RGGAVGAGAAAAAVDVDVLGGSGGRAAMVVSVGGGVSGGATTTWRAAADRVPSPSLRPAATANPEAATTVTSAAIGPGLAHHRFRSSPAGFVVSGSIARNGMAHQGAVGRPSCRVVPPFLT